MLFQELWSSIKPYNAKKIECQLNFLDPRWWTYLPTSGMGFSTRCPLGYVRLISDNRFLTFSCTSPQDDLDGPMNSNHRTCQHTELLRQTFDPGILWDEHGIDEGVVVGIIPLSCSAH